MICLLNPDNKFIMSIPPLLPIKIMGLIEININKNKKSFPSKMLN